MYIKMSIEKKKRDLYDGRKVLYGRVIQEQHLKYTGITLLRVQYINYYNYIDIVNKRDVEQINLIDKIKIFIINLRRR